MDYKYINEIIKVDGSHNNTLKLVKIVREGITGISVYSDYNDKTHCNVVTIHARDKGNIIESRKFLDSCLFPRKIERDKEYIKVYLESFKHEIKST